MFSVQTSQGTFNNCDVQVSLVDPDGQTVAGPLCGGTAGFIDATPDDAGQYFIRVAPSSTATGSVMVNLFQFTDLTATLAAGTGAVAHVTRPGQNFVGHYAGTAGGRVSVTVTGSTFPNCDGTSLSLLNPNGTTLATTGVCGTTLIDQTGLPTTGTYSVVLNPTATDTGTATVTLVKDNLSKLSVTPAAVLANATATSTVVVTLLDPAGSPIAGHTVTLTSTGSAVVTPPSGVSNGSGKVTFSVKDATAQAVTLTATDTTASVTAAVGALAFSAAAPQAPALSAGTPASVNLSSPGGIFAGTFTAGPGTIVGVNVTNASFTSCFTVLIVNPDGTALTSAHVCGPTFIGPATASQSGTYTAEIVPDPSFGGTGTANLTYYVETNQTLALTAGTPAGVNLSSPGMIFAGTFTASPGTILGVNVTSASFTSCFTTVIVNPDGSALTSAHVCGATFIGPATASQSGTYTAEIVPDPSFGGTGTATLTYYVDTNQTGSIKLNGHATAVSLPMPGDIFAQTFKAVAGNEVSVNLTSVSFSGCFTLALVDPNGGQVANVRSCGGNVSLSFVGLGRTGPYTVEIVPDSGGTGTASVALTGLAVASKLPTPQLGVHYSATLKAKPGTPTYAWAVSAGSLPAGLTLAGATGKVTGTPTTLGPSSFTITVTDAAFQTASMQYTITVVNPLKITTTSLPNGTVGTA